MEAKEQRRGNRARTCCRCPSGRGSIRHFIWKAEDETSVFSIGGFERPKAQQRHLNGPSTIVMRRNGCSAPAGPTTRSLPCPPGQALGHIPIMPFLRTWPRRAILLSNTQDSLLPRRNLLLQLFKPVQHDVDLCRGMRLLAWLDHQEVLTVR